MVLLQEKRGVRVPAVAAVGVDVGRLARVRVAAEVACDVGVLLRLDEGLLLGWSAGDPGVTAGSLLRIGLGVF